MQTLASILPADFIGQLLVSAESVSVIKNDIKTVVDEAKSIVTGVYRFEEPKAGEISAAGKVRKLAHLPADVQSAIEAGELPSNCVSFVSAHSLKWQAQGNTAAAAPAIPVLDAMNGLRKTISEATGAKLANFAAFRGSSRKARFGSAINSALENAGISEKPVAPSTKKYSFGVKLEAAERAKIRATLSEGGLDAKLPEAPIKFGLRNAPSEGAVEPESIFD